MEIQALHTKLRVGLLLNFNVPSMTHGIKRYQL